MILSGIADYVGTEGRLGGDAPHGEKRPRTSAHVPNRCVVFRESFVERWSIRPRAHRSDSGVMGDYEEVSSNPSGNHDG